MDRTLSLIEHYGYLVILFGVMLESTGVPLPGRCHRVRHPGGRYWGPDRLLARARGGQTIRLEVGALRLHHTPEIGTRRGVLREAWGQGRFHDTLLLRLARLRCPSGWHKPDALDNLHPLQRLGRSRLGYSGGPVGLLPRKQHRAGGALAGTSHADAPSRARRSGRLLPRLPLGRAQSAADGGVGRSAACLPSCGPLANALRCTVRVVASSPDAGAVSRAAPHGRVAGGGRRAVAVRRDCRGRVDRRPNSALRPGAGRLSARPRNASAHHILPHRHRPGLHRGHGALGVVVATFLAWGRRWVFLGSWLAAVAGSAVLNRLLKGLFERPRPHFEHPLLVESSFSFPSGHAMESFVVYGMLAYFAVLAFRTWESRVAVVFGAALLVVLIGFSRMYLGVHYFSDVLAGYAAGGVWLSALVTATEAITRRTKDAKPTDRTA